MRSRSSIKAKKHSVWQLRCNGNVVLGETLELTSKCERCLPNGRVNISRPRENSTHAREIPYLSSVRDIASRIGEVVH